MDPAEAERVARWLVPLASPRRLRLLAFCTEPHYLEEIASHLGVARQSARRHVDQLVDIGVLERRPGERDGVAVTEYVVQPHAMFLLQDAFAGLAILRPRPSAAHPHRTVEAPGGSPPRPQDGPCLWSLGPGSGGRRLALERRSGRVWLVGRDPGCDLVLEADPFVSGRHLELRYERGAFRAADLRSRNGTDVNWRRVPTGGEAEIRHGDVLRVGRTTLVAWDA